jgi:hypothetical protein
MMRPEGDTIVAIAGDPGGAAALAPVLESLQQDGRGVRALAYRQAVSRWRGRGLAVVELAESTDQETALQYLRDRRAGILLSATSVNGVDLERIFIMAARCLSIPSVAVLDHWANYRLRFTDKSGELSCCPDRIAVMDERARDEMIAEGFAFERLVITGQPAFDELASFQRDLVLRKHWETRQALGVGENERMVLFASEPISTIFGTEPSQRLYPGYTERTVLTTLVQALDRIAGRRPERIVLVVRPHPLDNPDDLTLPYSGRLRLIWDGRGSGRDAVLAADLVAGMTTILLVEACMLGCIVISLQPGLRHPDVLPTNSRGVSTAVYREADIEKAVEELLFDEMARKAAIQRTKSICPRPGAAQRVVKLLDSLRSTRESFSRDRTRE